jgi:hypothetical protein
MDFKNGFRVRIKIRQKLTQNKRRLERRRDKNDLSGCERLMLTRQARCQVKTQPRTWPEKIPERIVQERGRVNLRLQGEDLGEFRDRSVDCRQAYRMVLVRRDRQITGGQQKRFEMNRGAASSSPTHKRKPPDK